MAATPDGKGYWLVASDGGIFTYGDAVFYGSTGAIHLNEPIVGMALSPDGGGYWLVASDGGIFTFGDTPFFGSTGASHLNEPIVGMAATPDRRGGLHAGRDGRQSRWLPVVGRALEFAIGVECRLLRQQLHNAADGEHGDPRCRPGG
jgi:hypothetical protein